MKLFRKLKNYCFALKNGVAVYCVHVNDNTLCFNTMDEALDYIDAYRSRYNKIQHLAVTLQYLVPIDFNNYYNENDC